MPTVDEHLAKVVHNSSFLDQLQGILDQLQGIMDRYADWIITVYFYIALHLIDAYLATNSIHPPTHHLRDSYIRRDPRLHVIYGDYRYLEDLSRDARYTVYAPNQHDIQDCKTSLVAIRNHLRSSFPGGL